jgi:hypothetical protein
MEGETIRPGFYPEHRGNIFSETSVTTEKTAGYYNPDDHNSRYVNLISQYREPQSNFACIWP